MTNWHSTLLSSSLRIFTDTPHACTYSAVLTTLGLHSLSHDHRALRFFKKSSIDPARLEEVCLLASVTIDSHVISAGTFCVAMPVSGKRVKACAAIGRGLTPRP